jgi:hypothetical protein
MKKAEFEALMEPVRAILATQNQMLAVLEWHSQAIERLPQRLNEVGVPIDAPELRLPQSH